MRQSSQDTASFLLLRCRSSLTRRLALLWSARWAATQGWHGTAPRKPADSNVMVWSGSSGVSAEVDVHAMGCGWLNPSYTENPTM